MLRVLVTDDDQGFLNCLERSLKSDKIPVEICKALSGEEALELLAENKYDALTLDMVMPEMDGLETLKRVRALYPKLPVLMVTFLPENEVSVHRALMLGADGYIEKMNSRVELFPALELIIQTAHPEKSLSPREHEVARLLASGKSETKIAQELGLSVKTVSTYKQRIFEKMDFRTDADLFRYTIKTGWD